MGFVLLFRSAKKVTEASTKIISNETVNRDGGAKSTQTRIVIQGASLWFH